MWNKIDSLCRPLFKLFQSLNREEWIVVFVIVLAVGYFCMRGFGSRAKY